MAIKLSSLALTISALKLKLHIKSDRKESSMQQTSVDVVAHLIQLAVAPVFLIAGVGAILNVLSGRLARITDRIERINSVINDARLKNIDITSETLEVRRLQRKYLRIRAKNMNMAILFCILTGILVALVIMMLFMSSIFDFNAGLLITVAFITAMVSLMISLILFVREIFMATYFMQRTQKKIKLDFG
jgi:hypothetical protein